MVPSRTVGVPGTAVRAPAVNRDSELNNLPFAVEPGISDRVVAEQISRQPQCVLDAVVPPCLSWHWPGVGALVAAGGARLRRIYHLVSAAKV